MWREGPAGRPAVMAPSVRGTPPAATAAASGGGGFLAFGVVGRKSQPLPSGPFQGHGATVMASPPPLEAAAAYSLSAW